MGTTTKVIIDGKKYEIDLDQAQKLGLCKPVRQPITRIEAGDIFDSPFSSRILIIQSGYCSNGNDAKFSMAGLNGLRPFSDMPKHKSRRDYADSETILFSRAQMIEHLNGLEVSFVTNINSEIDKLIHKCAEKK